MPTILVTGATGFLGANTVRALLKRRWKVRALVRTSSDLSTLNGLDIEIVHGDMLDSSSVVSSMKGTDGVFHMAANYALWTKKPRELFDANVKGTENVMNAALEAGIPRVVYTSSVAAVARHKDGTPSAENDYATASQMPGAYERSKVEAERIVREMARAKSLPVVIVNPSAPVGAFDSKPTPLGKTIVDLLQGRVAGYLDSGMNIVDADDVAEGHILAFERGRIGERYILGNKNVTLKEFFDLVCSIGGISPPKRKIPYSVAWLAGFSSEAFARFSGKPPAVPLNGVRLARNKMYFDSSKAIRDLGFPQTPIEEAVRKSIMWFRANKYA